MSSICARASPAFSTPATSVEPVRVSRYGRRYFSEAHKGAVLEKYFVSSASVSAVELGHGFDTTVVRKPIAKHPAASALAQAGNSNCARLLRTNGD